MKCLRSENVGEAFLPERGMLVRVQWEALAPALNLTKITPYSSGRVIGSGQVSGAYVVRKNTHAADVRGGIILPRANCARGRCPFSIPERRKRHR